MADRFIQSRIARLPLFQRLTPDQLAWVAEIAEVLRFEAGQFVLRQGERTQGMLLFASGRGQLTQIGPDKVEREIGTVGPNSYLNESALFVETTGSVTLQVTESSIVLFLPRQKMMQVLAAHPEMQAQMKLPPGTNFRVAPPGIHKVFDGQREGENVIVIVRRHWWAFVRWIWTAVLVGVGLLILAGLARDVPLISAALTGLALVASGGWIVYLYIEWYNDSLIITNQRVIHTARQLFPYRTNVSEIPLSVIHEVNSDFTRSVAGNLLRFGTVQIKTAGNSGNVTFDFVHNPQALQNIIFTDRARYQEGLSEQNRAQIRAEIDKFLKEKAGQSANQAAKKADELKNKSAPLSPFVMRYMNAEGEIVFRKHVLIWFTHIIAPALVTMGGVVALAAGLAGGLGVLAVLPAVLIFAVGVGWFILADWDWRNDLYILGDETVTLIHKRPLWMQNQKDQVILSEVDNVVGDSSGFASFLFRIGDVSLFLTGADKKDAKVFKSVFRPLKVQEEISKRQEQAKKRKKDKEVQQRHREIVQYLDVYHDSTSSDSQQIITGQSQPPSAVRDRIRPPGIPRVRPEDTEQ